MQYPLLAALPPPVVFLIEFLLNWMQYALLAPSPCYDFLLNSYSKMMPYPVMAAFASPSDRF